MSAAANGSHGMRSESTCDLVMAAARMLDDDRISAVPLVSKRALIGART